MNINISFSRKVLNKIIKYLILFILACIFIYYSNIVNVNAAGTPLDNIRELYFPSHAAFYNINNGVAYSVSTSTYLDSYYVNDTEYNVYSYYTPSSISLNSSGYGFGLLVALPFYLSDNVIYSLDLYIGTSSNPGGFKIPPNRNVDLTTNANNYNNSNSVGLSYYKSSSYFMSELFTSSSSTFPYYVYNVSVPFRSLDSASRYIFIPLTTLNNYTGSLYFFGMNIYINGQLFDTSSLATSTDIELAEDNINSNIDAMQEAIIEQEQQTQDKIDEQIQQDKEQHEEQMESQQVCTKKIIDKNNIIEDGFLDEDGTKINSTTDGITNYIEINNVTKIKVLQVWEWSNSCFYDNNKTKISCFKNNQTVGSYIKVPQNAKYIRISIQKNTNKPQYEIETCKNGNQALNDSLNNSDTSGANQDANNFFNNFENNDFGLSDIITLPLTTIQSITSKSCTPLSLTLPFVNKTFELPCMNTIYSKFEPFYSIYQTITFGVISYWVCVQIYAMVKGFKDPTSDEIEVMDL